MTIAINKIAIIIKIYKYFLGNRDFETNTLIGNISGFDSIFI